MQVDEDGTDSLIREAISSLCFSSFPWVVLGFSSLAIVNVATLLLGPFRILVALNNSPLGVFVSWTVFDSWGTIYGLLGVVLLFIPVLLGAEPSERRSLAKFFLFGSLIIGVGVSVLWSQLYKSGNGLIPFGSSSIDIVAQSFIFTLSISSLIGLFASRQITPQLTKEDATRKRNSFAIIYSVLIGTTLWFIFVLEPIFVPSNEFNWRVHEFGFIAGVLASVVYLLSAKLLV